MKPIRLQRSDLSFPVHLRLRLATVQISHNGASLRARRTHLAPRFILRPIRRIRTVEMVHSGCVAQAVFLFQNGDLHVESTLEDAAGYMEPVDVEAGEYDVVYDITGAIYLPVVEENQTLLLATGATDYADLVIRLKRFGDAAGVNFPTGDPDFTLTAARAVAEWEWRLRWPKRPAWLSRWIHGSEPPRFARL